MKRGSDTMRKRIAIWGGAQVALLLLLCGLMAAAIMAEWIRPEMGQILTMALAIVMIFVCSLLSARSAPRQRLAVSMLTAAVPAAAGLAAKLIAFADWPVNWKWILPVLGAAAAAGVIASGKKTRKR